VNKHQKGKTIQDFNETTDDGAAVAPAGPHASHLHIALCTLSQNSIPPNHQQWLGVINSNCPIIVIFGTDIPQ